MTAEQNKCGDIPAHNKDPDADTHNKRTGCIDPTQVFRRQEQRIYTERGHKAAIHDAEQDKPKDQEYLELFKMEQQQLNRKGIKYEF